MPYSITYSTRNSTIIFYFSWHPLWICYDVRCVHFTVPSSRRDALFYLRAQMCTHSATHSSKRFKPLSTIILLCQGYCWIGKNTNKELNCVMLMVLVIRRSSNLKFQFVFDFNECLWAIFSLLSFKIFGFILGLGLYILLLIFWHRWPEVTFYHSYLPMNKKLECKDHQINSKMLRRIFS